jgi:hypothetical protein
MCLEFRVIPWIRGPRIGSIISDPFIVYAIRVGIFRPRSNYGSRVSEGCATS